MNDFPSDLIASPVLGQFTTEQVRSRGAGMKFMAGEASSPFGRCWVAGHDGAIHQLAFIDDAPPPVELARLQAAGILPAELGLGVPRGWLARLQALWPQARIEVSPEWADEQIGAAFGGGKVAVRALGTSFQACVWNALMTIPRGQTISYSGLARAIARPGAQRAVGSAVAANPVAVLIPCHRVIQESGGIGQYRWGAARKRAILDWEGSGQGLGWS